MFIYPMLIYPDTNSAFFKAAVITAIISTLIFLLYMFIFIRHVKKLKKRWQKKSGDDISVIDISATVADKRISDDDIPVYFVTFKTIENRIIEMAVPEDIFNEIDIDSSGTLSVLGALFKGFECEK